MVSRGFKVWQAISESKVLSSIHSNMTCHRPLQETFPTRALVDNTDAALDRWIRTGFSFFSWHATGTAKIAAAADPLGVLDERLRVRGGVTGLRVADASAVPDMIEAGPMATLYMVGERAADLIKEDHAPRPKQQRAAGGEASKDGGDADGDDEDEAW